ncbi:MULTISPECIES: FecCD family ABC transporter permease [unclassified Rhodococcus (in: high G+C Gram-positive bacteria)]|uniref:FecCD family ABC transporter permease n=1 Tax=unclassified Rhodococcus (in: high G+C Gram-positive bacteria) TaxID=192944 RepID=UPI0009E88895|nr:MULTISPECIES: iron chelate uptake ABC transporter family permease subunit [unclassified Rhodococcus (in: high G+C Gram-positive bacteria)]
MRVRPALAVVATLLAVVASVAVSIALGPANVTVPDVVAVVVAHLGGPPADVSRIQDGIVWELRLPRALLAAICGCGLALCGAIMQSLLRNRLADPFVLGISSGASTGAVSVAVLGVGAGALSLSTGAFVGALVSFVLVMMLATGAGGGTGPVILAGVAGTQLFSALTSFIVLSSADAEQTRGVLFWLLGSLAGAGWGDVAVCAGAVGIGAVACVVAAPSLDAVTLGSDTARALGVSMLRLSVVLLGVTALMTATIVASAGAIGFVGLVIPHAARILVGTAHHRVLPVSMAIGAVFMVWADTLARSVFAPQEIPVGVVTALVGVPAFAVILLRGRRGVR